MSEYGYKHKEHVKVSYDDIDMKDRRAVLQARDSILREQWVRSMEVRLVREQLAKCYKSEGVNHYVNCKELAEKYMEMLRTHRGVTGYAFLERTSNDL